MSGRWLIGVDIGGTNTVVAAVPYQGGEPAAIRTVSTRPERGAEAAVADIATMTEAVITEVLSEEGGTREDVLGVGIGCPGPLDLRKGIVG